MLRGLVALVGRTNVGKSTLFNRLTRSKDAIVDDQPGVTRDRIYGVCYDDKTKVSGFNVIDTGGFETGRDIFRPEGENIVWQQTQAAIHEADLVILLLDGKHGVHPHDKILVDYLRRHDKPVVYAVNKIDGIEKSDGVYEFYLVGVENPLAVSAAHNKGIRELSQQVQARLAYLSYLQRPPNRQEATRVAIVGRPNVGKSSLLNRLAGSERALVSHVAGTTRDSVDIVLQYHAASYVIVDTAGMRRKAKIQDKLESHSVMRAIRAIDRAEVVVLVLDAVSGLSDQDQKIAHIALSRYKPLLIVVNKWDLIEDKHTHSARDYARDLRDLGLGGMSYVPIMFTSCATNQRVAKVMGAVADLAAMYKKRVVTSKVNETLQKALFDHTPQLIRKYSKRVKFYYASQVSVAPPTFVLKCNVPGEVQTSYLRYLENRIRGELGFDSIPLRLSLRGKKKDDSVFSSDQETCVN